ncbi:MAG: AI-2E family transporter [Lachnospiraceae bacterium]|nr:AI-2E family transporter [Lachnospiraceae bacterium]
MKWKPDKNQIRWGVTAFVVVACCMLFYFVLFHGQKIASGIHSFLHAMMAVNCGIVIAYVLSPVLGFVEKRIFAPVYSKKGIDLHDPVYAKEKRSIRKWSLLVTMLLFLLAVGILLMVIIPQLIKSVRSIIVGLPFYVANIVRYSNTYLADHPDLAKSVESYYAQASGWITDFVNNTLIPQATVFIRGFSKSVLGFFSGFFNFIIGIIVAVYLLNSKESFKAGAKKGLYAFFKEDIANELLSGARFAHYTFSGFIVGKLVDSAIIGVITYVGALILRTPYPLLMAVIVGVTNIIPFFGPYIGEILTFILLLLINPLSSVIFLAFVIILQQIDGNILGPKILGNSTGLSSFWVIFSVLFFGSILGVAGWILGVPLFAVLYAMIGRLTDHFLRKRKLPVETEVYGEAAYAEKGVILQKPDADPDLYHVRHPVSIWKRIFGSRGKQDKVPAQRTADSGDTPAEDVQEEPPVLWDDRAIMRRVKGDGSPKP